MSLKNKLNRFKPQLIKNNPEKLPEQSVAATKKLPFIKEWKEAGAEIYYSDKEYCLIREVRYPLAFQHGNYTFKDFVLAMNIWNDFSGNHPLSAKGLKPSELFFFDTETTGLYGGAGNTIFLLGYARVLGEEVIVRQHFLPEPGLEVPLYKSFLETVDYKTLVTYNGKAFDWPQVKTRHTLVRQHVPKLPAFGHFDLYHASRRLWKDDLPSVKLSNVEKEILGIIRENDVPGYLAPMIYFDYVERKNPEGILKVLKHNEIDILSLITLYTHITFQIHLLDPDQTPAEKTTVGKWFEYTGSREIAASVFEVAADENDPRAKHQLAFHHKRAKDYGKAKSLWLEVKDDGEPLIKKAALIELAKLMEHQYKDYAKALHYTNEALHIHGQSFNARAAKADLFSVEAAKRIRRLKRK